MAKIDFGGFKEEESQGAYSPVAKGKYHLVVLDIDDSFTSGDAIVVNTEVLAGTIEGQAGKSFKTFFNLPSHSHKDHGKFCRGRIARISEVLGLATAKQIEANPDIDIPFASAAGRQLVADVLCEEDSKGKMRSSIDGFNFWNVTDPATVDVPKDANALAMIGVVAGGLGAVGAGGGGVATAVQQATQAPVDQFANI